MKRWDLVCIGRWPMSCRRHPAPIGRGYCVLASHRHSCAARTLFETNLRSTLMPNATHMSAIHVAHARPRWRGGRFVLPNAAVATPCSSHASAGWLGWLGLGWEICDVAIRCNAPSECTATHSSLVMLAESGNAMLGPVAGDSLLRYMDAVRSLSWSNVISPLRAVENLGSAYLTASY